jgi:hypothetical protein
MTWADAPKKRQKTGNKSPSGRNIVMMNESESTPMAYSALNRSGMMIDGEKW